MKKLTLLIFIGICGSLRAQNTIRVVNGTNLQAIIDTVAVNGDRIILEGGDYGSITISKRLTIIGTGYLLDNSNSATVRESKLGDIIFNIGSELSKVIGLTANNISVNTDRVEISRCHITYAFYIGFTNPANYVIVKQNLISAPGIFSISNNSHSFLIRNNIFFGSLVMETNGIGYFWYNTLRGQIVSLKTPESIEFKNNIFSSLNSPSYGSGGFVYLMRNYYPPLCTYNIFGQNNFTNLPSTFSTSQNNILLSNPDFYKGFPSNPNSLKTDEAYTLNDSSPAKGACENGTDCGAFGGSEPYVLCGIPNTPSITEMNVQLNNGVLNVQLKAKANN